MAYSLLTGCLNAFTNLYFLLGFSSGPFSVGSSSKSKLGRKYDWKESYCNNILSKHFRKLNQLVETWFITFLTSLLLRLMNSLSCVLHSYETDSICHPQHLQKVLWLPFPAHKCAKWQGQPTQKIFWSPCVLCIFWRRLLRCPIIEFPLSKKYVTQLSQSS